MTRILVTGSLGQIGAELVPALRAKHGADSVVSSDIRTPPRPDDGDGLYVHLDCTSQEQLHRTVTRYDIDTIYHLAAVLSAVAEQKPDVAWDVNMGGLYRVLQVAREHQCSVFVPSSIGAFGPSTPRDHTPQDTIQRPTSMYGVTKVAGELLCDYYHRRFGVDIRGVRYPGLVSHVAPPGGGTTDYVVEIFYEALRNGRYTCFLRGDTRLDMMYMPDAITAAIAVMEADTAALQHRNAFNVSAMNFTPEELSAEIRRHVPEFTMSYDIDPMRQAIADSWPNSIDDSAAREEWAWKPTFDLQAMTADMLHHLRPKVQTTA